MSWFVRRLTEWQETKRYSPSLFCFLPHGVPRVTLVVPRNLNPQLINTLQRIASHTTAYLHVSCALEVHFHQASHRGQVPGLADFACDKQWGKAQLRSFMEGPVHFDIKLTGDKPGLPTLRRSSLAKIILRTIHKATLRSLYCGVYYGSIVSTLLKTDSFNFRPSHCSLLSAASMRITPRIGKLWITVSGAVHNIPGLHSHAENRYSP